MSWRTNAVLALTSFEDSLEKKLKSLRRSLRYCRQNLNEIAEVFVDNFYELTHSDDDEKSKKSDPDSLFLILQIHFLLFMLGAIATVIILPEALEGYVAAFFWGAVIVFSVLLLPFLLLILLLILLLLPYLACHLLVIIPTLIIYLLIYIPLSMARGIRDALSYPERKAKLLKRNKEDREKYNAYRKEEFSYLCELLDITSPEEDLNWLNNKQYRFFSDIYRRLEIRRAYSFSLTDKEKKFLDITEGKDTEIRSKYFTEEEYDELILYREN